MAGSPEVKVRIAADNKDLDSGLAGASRSLGDFAGKIPLVGAAVAAAGAAVAAFAKGAVDEAAKAEVGMVRLGAAVTNAGGDFRRLSPVLEDAVAKVQRLSTATDDDLRAALTNMITISGDVSGSMKNLSLVTDVAAFSGKSLEESATLVGKAMTGNVKALSQFGNEVKLANDPLQALRDKVAGFAEKEANTFTGSLQRINNQWGEFQEAVGKAILGGGEASAMADGLAGVLANLVGWVERNEESFVIVKDAIFGAVGALLAIGKAVYDVVQPALGPVMKVLFGALLVSLNTATLGVRTLAGFFKGMAGDVLQSLGTIVEKGGRLLKIFGVDVVAETGASIKEFGRNLTLSASDQVAAAQATYTKGMARLFGERTTATREMEVLEEGHQKRVTAIHEKGGKERLTKAQEKAELMKLYMSQANDIFASTSKALEESSRPVLRDMKADWSEIDRKVQEAAKSITVAKESQEELAEAGESVRKKQEAILDEATATKEKFKQQVDEVSSIADSMLGIASSAGLLDEKAASTLSSVLKMGTDLAKFGFTSPQGILSIVSGLSTLIAGWGTSAAEQARKDAIAQNTRAIEELSRDLSEYNLGVTGEDFASVTETLGSVVDPPDYLKNIPGFVPEDPLKALRRAGLEGQARKLAEKYGIDVDKDPGGWAKLFGILKKRQFGSPEGNFADELSSIESSFGVLGIDDADDQFGMFADFAKKYIPALAIPLSTFDTKTEGGRAALADKLKELYRLSIQGKLTPAEYGKASASQFRQVIGSLLGILGKADGFLGSAQSTAPATPPVPVGGGALSPNVGGGTSGLISGGVTPTVGVGSGSFVGLELGGASIGTQNNTVTLHVQAHPDESAAIYAERVAALVSAQLGQRYKLQRAALGLV